MQICKWTIRLVPCRQSPSDSTRKRINNKKTFRTTTTTTATWANRWSRSGNAKCNLIVYHLLSLEKFFDLSQPYQENIPPPLKDELVIDRLSAVQVRPSYDALRKEAADLEAQIRQVQDSLDTLLRIQQRSLEASLFNKANEIQEDISMKRFDLRVAQMHLKAINSQVILKNFSVTHTFFQIK